jgi:hypothetical protein
MTFQQLLDFIESLLRQFWPGLAVMFFDYEETKVDHAQKELEAAQLIAQNLKDKSDIEAKYAGKTDSDIINNIAGSDGTTPSGTKPDGS